MNHRLKGYTLLHGDFDSPEIPIAEFSKVFNSKDRKEIVAAMNQGDKMLRIYKKHRDNFHITNIVDMLKEMERVYRDWECASREKWSSAK